jgi:P27 family predicted phage terminase small subunit
VVQGTRRDRVNDREPQPDPEVAPEPPAWLDETALAVWRRLAPDMIAKKVLTGWDVETFAIVCDAVARHAQAAQLVAQRGVMVSGDKGRLVKNPAAQLVRDYAAIVATFGGRFGLTPADRAHILAGAKAPISGAERLLS